MRRHTAQDEQVREHVDDITGIQPPRHPDGQVPLFQRGLKCSVLALIVVAPLQIYLGDGIGQVVAKDQPAALAALEGHYHTFNPDGTVNSSWNLVA